MIKRLVLDVLIPNKISIVDFAESLSKLNGIDAVNITVKEVDVETQNIIVVIEGENIVFNDVNELIEKMGGTIHSVDQVVAGKRVINLPEEVSSEL
ncbi:MAG: hypothetical protein B6U89_03190 [Desulfurococcales archaeon ex4484_58]|nr:MAG: hypothetical protein B6U89_03190 [Desulfurococcales archaeon ex4484_58]